MMLFLLNLRKKIQLKTSNPIAQFSKKAWNSTTQLLQYRESGFKGPVAKIKFQELDRQAIKGLVDQIM